MTTFSIALRTMGYVCRQNGNIVDFHMKFDIINGINRLNTQTHTYDLQNEFHSPYIEAIAAAVACANTVPMMMSVCVCV